MYIHIMYIHGHFGKIQRDHFKQKKSTLHNISTFKKTRTPKKTIKMIAFKHNNVWTNLNYVKLIYTKMITSTWNFLPLIILYLEFYISSKLGSKID